MQRGNGEFFHLYTIHQYTPSFLLAFCNTSYAQKTEKDRSEKTSYQSSTHGNYEICHPWLPRISQQIQSSYTFGILNNTIT
ncbi:hypothetical protein E1A91_D08G229600v1 [Gossypium mustelinum]|uniref:Uncharacterized protein n=1 Tax=Gossypium mustelinum TaxID=34275 RepID=A0A5D2U1V6_GOSMU|nr:hypothetical protein E1A91_D08G229600v1 [Gossypium mustelinum]